MREALCLSAASLRRSCACGELGVRYDSFNFSSHAVWQSRAALQEWTKSEAFRAAHHRAGDNTLDASFRVRGRDRCDS